MQASLVGGPFDGDRTKAPLRKDRNTVGCRNAIAKVVSSKRSASGRILYKFAIYTYSKTKKVYEYKETVDDLSKEDLPSYMDKKYPHRST